MWLWAAQKSRYVCGVEGGPVSWCSEFEDWGKATSSYDFILVASGFKMPCESIGSTTVLTKQEKGVTSSRPATTGPARPRNTAGWWWQRGSRSDRPDSPVLRRDKTTDCDTPLDPRTPVSPALWASLASQPRDNRVEGSSASAQRRKSGDDPSHLLGSWGKATALTVGTRDRRNPEANPVRERRCCRFLTRDGR